MTERVGLFGGTFNPIHSGHLRAGEEVMERFVLNRILFVPSYIPPHKGIGDVASAEDRFRMVELACRGQHGFVPSSIEVEAPETSYSILSLEKIKALYPGAWLFFILGADAFMEIGTWREYDRILAECRFIVLDRPGFELASVSGVLGGRLKPSMAMVGREEATSEDFLERFRVFLLPIRALDISSTDIRNRIRRGESVSGLVPEAVERYIHQNRLYRDRE